MKINPKNLTLTPKVIAELESNYLTIVHFKDYFLDYLVYNRPLSKQFFTLLQTTLEDPATDNDERWEKEYMGRDKDGWEHVESRAYKGPNPRYGDPNSLHLKIHIKFKKKSVRSGGLIGGVINGVGSLALMVGAMFAADSLFPVKEGESTFGRDFLIGFGVLEGLDMMDRKRDKEQQIEERLRRLEGDEE